MIKQTSCQVKCNSINAQLTSEDTEYDIVYTISIGHMHSFWAIKQNSKLYPPEEQCELFTLKSIHDDSDDGYSGNLLRSESLTEISQVLEWVAKRVMGIR
jgi:hypothetical protein